MDYIKSKLFFTLNGGILTQGIDLNRIVSNYDKIQAKINNEIDGILLSTFVDDVRDFGEIISDQNGRIVDFKEKQQMKSGHINGEIYLFNQSSL